MASVDVSNLVTAIADVVAPVVLTGLAVLAVYSALASFRFLRMALGQSDYSSGGFSSDDDIQTLPSETPPPTAIDVGHQSYIEQGLSKLEALNKARADSWFAPGSTDRFDQYESMIKEGYSHEEAMKDVEESDRNFSYWRSL